MELIRKDLVYKQEDAVVNADKYDVRRFNELYKMAGNLRNLCEANQQVPQFTNLVGDVWASFYKSAPSLQDVKPELELNRGLIEKLLINPDYQSQHEHTKLDDLLSTVTSIHMSKELLNWIQQQPEAKEYHKQLKKIQEREDKAQQDIQQATNQLANLSSLAIQKEMESLLKRAEKRLSRAQEAKHQLQQDFSNVTDNLSKEQLGQMLSQAAERSNETTQQMNQLMGEGTGSGKGDYSQLPIRDQFLLAQVCEANPKMKEIALLAGRFKQIAKDKQKSFHKEAIARKGVTVGNELERLLPSEYMQYLLPQANVDFMKRFSEAQTLIYDKKGKSKLGKGPIICCIDESGSMRKLDTQSKAFLIALMSIARKQHRDFAVIPFSSTVGQIEILPKGKCSVTQLKDLCSRFMGGGTVFEEPLQAALQLIEKARFKQADMIFVTDGESNISEGLLQAFRTVKKKKGFDCTAVVIGNSANVNIVKQFADKVVQVNDLFSATDVFLF
ncbi:VWA domain-containing protein [Lysinibacillus sp. KU-BSD001]|uniref:VWA domain-containing protein n=1 Tax=Lysinibacillus sp. KU-BSD001 TaxID=3141328 RepID=UPI0036E80A4E